MSLETAQVSNHALHVATQHAKPSVYTFSFRYWDSNGVRRTKYMWVRTTNPSMAEFAVKGRFDVA